jgi:hypothetical protein
MAEAIGIVATPLVAQLDTTQPDVNTRATIEPEIPGLASLKVVELADFDEESLLIALNRIMSKVSWRLDDPDPTDVAVDDALRLIHLARALLFVIVLVWIVITVLDGPVPASSADDFPKPTLVPLHGSGSSLSPPASSMHSNRPVEALAA